MKNFYDILGVPENASDDDIKTAYRRLAKRFHPDRNTDDPNAEARFKEVSEAYDTLSDKEKRQKYDLFRKYGSAGFGPGGPGGGASFNFGGGDFSSIFSQMFGGGGFGGFGRHSQTRTRTRTESGEDRTLRLNVPFDVVRKGGSADLRVETDVDCRDCKGTGSATKRPPKACPQCGGTGQSPHAFGGFSMAGPCDTCFGSGRIIEQPCKVCSGSGVASEKKTISIDIPQGISDGEKLRIAGLGKRGDDGGPPGDLYVEVRSAMPAGLAREGLDVRSEADVPMVLAALGGKLAVKTAHGSIDLEIPAGIQPGRTLRLAGQGLTRGGRIGAHLVTMKVQIPGGLSDAQRELLLHFADSTGERRVNGRLAPGDDAGKGARGGKAKPS